MFGTCLVARAWERSAGCRVPVLWVPGLAPGSCAAFLSHIARLGEPLKGVLVSRPLFDSTIFASGNGTFGLTHHPSPVATPATALHSGSAVLCYEHGLRRWASEDGAMFGTCLVAGALRVISWVRGASFMGPRQAPGPLPTFLSQFARLGKAFRWLAQLMPKM